MTDPDHFVILPGGDVKYNTPATAHALTEPRLDRLSDFGIVLPHELATEPGPILAALGAARIGGDPWDAAFASLAPRRRAQKLAAYRQRLERTAPIDGFAHVQQFAKTTPFRRDEFSAAFVQLESRASGRTDERS